MAMVSYQRDKNGKINKDSTLFVESQKVVDSAVNELIEGTKTAQTLKENTESIEKMDKLNLSTSLAITELYEMMLNLMSANSNPEN